MFSETAAIRVIGLMGSIEAMVPAFAPILGALMIAAWGWTSPAWAAAGVATVSLVAQFLVRLEPASYDQKQRKINWTHEVKGYVELFYNRRFLGFALSHALMFGALLTYIFSAPQLITQAFDEPIVYFTYMQLMGVAMFVIAANASGLIAKRIGSTGTLWLGQGLLSVGALGLLIGALAGVSTWWQMVGLMLPFLLGLGIRGGTGIVVALDAAPGYGARAMALILFMAMALSAIGCAAVAPTLADGLLGTGLAVFAFVAASGLFLRTASLRHAVNV